jgi:nondiscriminating glutamyl-tRNA synthetase
VPPRVRFAPSPTGYLHVGGARTALFNWLYARRESGTFVLRIDDTDTKRSSADMTAGILDGMRWLGLDWDEGPEVGGPHAPYYQSQRLEQYREAAQRLVKQRLAYPCFCTPERLQSEREQAEQRGEVWRYDRTCLALSPDRVAELEAAGTKHVIRFRVPTGRTVFEDAVRGRIKIDHATIEDLVIVRSDAQPTYHLSNVVDDIDMAITHVLRGDDHISNTPKHILLFRALDSEVPVFAHLPLILGPDKKRLSKRHGATAIGEYREQGFLPEAMANFLAQLGWSPGDDRELMSRVDVVDAFSLDGVSGGSAVFDVTKLEWMNAKHIAMLPIAELSATVRPVLEADGLWPAEGRDETWLRQLLEVLRPRAKRLVDFPDQAQPFLAEPDAYEPAAVRKHLSGTKVAPVVGAIRSALDTLEPFDESHLETAIRRIIDEHGFKMGAVMQPVRIGLTGRTASPGIFETILLLGRERTLARLDALLAFLARLEGI